jgi:hypothetical protein
VFHKKSATHSDGYHPVELFFITQPTILENAADAVRMPVKPPISSFMSNPQRLVAARRFCSGVGIVMPNITPMLHHYCLKYGTTAYIKKSADGELPTVRQ